MSDWVINADGVPLNLSKKIRLVIAGGRDIDESLAVTIINEAMIDLGLVACVNVVESFTAAAELALTLLSRSISSESFP